MHSYDIIWNKGYQRFDAVTSTVKTKVKGLGYYNLNTNSLLVQLNSTLVPMSKKFRIFDTADYVIPPNEYNAIFIMTLLKQFKQ